MNIPTSQTLREAGDGQTKVQDPAAQLDPDAPVIDKDLHNVSIGMRR